MNAKPTNVLASVDFELLSALPVGTAQPSHRTPSANGKRLARHHQPA